jgi:excisionase family DNA binding protein
MDEVLKELQELKNLTVLSAKQALTMSDTALITGLSKSHLYKLVCAKKIPYYKSQGGKLTYFDKDELNKWMLQHRVKTSDELETEAITYTVTGKHSKKGGKNV